jgi:mono/diheme cytochrome c family protein
LLGCAGEQAAGDAISAQAKAEAAALYGERCASCHGVAGKGDGPEAAKLKQRPRNFSDPTWQLAVPDHHLQKVIVQGGPAVGKSPEMPAHPDLGTRPQVLAALRQHLRVLAASP